MNLKLFQDSCLLAHSAHHLKDCVGYKVFVEKLQLPAFMPGDLKQDDLARTLHSGCYCGQQEEIKEIYAADIPKNSKIPQITLLYNRKEEYHRILAIKLKTKVGLLGRTWYCRYPDTRNLHTTKKTQQSILLPMAAR